MKKIINNKAYDTETAKELGSWSNMADYGNLSQFSETLYRKKTGEFFLYGEGGPMTKYAVAEGSNSWRGGSLIMPLSFLGARDWAEKHLDAGAYEAIFGEVVEDDSRVQVCYSLSAQAAEMVKRRAAELGISASAYVESLIK